jgi:hypothetical protein
MIGHQRRRIVLAIEEAVNVKSELLFRSPQLLDLFRQTAPATLK